MNTQTAIDRIIAEHRNVQEKRKIQRHLDERIQLGMLIFSAIGFVFVLRFL